MLRHGNRGDAGNRGDDAQQSNGRFALHRLGVAQFAAKGNCMALPRLVVFARFPEPGQCKTRLIPSLGPTGAAGVHRTLTARTVDLLRRFGPVELRHTGAEAARFADWLGDDITLVEQVPGDLTDRLLDALEPAPVIFFGADTPDLAPAHVAAAIDALAQTEVVIGPAEDGGYYLIGVARPHRFLFEQMPWSTEQVLPETLRRLDEAAITPVLLDTLADCDRPEDLARWPWLTA